MRKSRGPLWWYQLRYGVPRWIPPLLAASALLVAFNAERVYRYTLILPVCRKVADAPSGMSAERMAPTDGVRWQMVSRCLDGYTDVSGHVAH